MIKPIPIIHYLLSLLNVTPDQLTVKAERLWGDVFALAKQQKIYFTLIGLILEYQPDILPPALLPILKRDISANTARNGALSLQISALARLFREAGIPLIFMKGGACLIRNIYPIGWRQMNDLDILVPGEHLARAFALLMNNGYYTGSDGIQQAHHMQPLYHRDSVGMVELHSDPYQLETQGGRVTTEILKAAEKVVFLDEPALVPNPTDHLWILMRTDIISRVAIPRLFDVIEFCLFVEKRIEIDYLVFARRAGKDRMPHLVSSLSRSCCRFGELRPFATWDENYMVRWEEWSSMMQRKEYRSRLLHSYWKRFMAVMFLPEQGVKSKIGFGWWLARQLVFVDRFTPGSYRARTLMAGVFMYSKLFLEFLYASLEYIIFHMTKRVNSR